MKLFNYDALFPSVATDFTLLHLHQYFEIAKFVYQRISLKMQAKALKLLCYSHDTA